MLYEVITEGGFAGAVTAPARVRFDPRIAGDVDDAGARFKLSLDCLEDPKRNNFV